jgi:hypothetical protein
MIFFEDLMHLASARMEIEREFLLSRKRIDQIDSVIFLSLFCRLFAGLPIL